MPLSSNTLRELHDELLELQQRRDLLDRQIKGIELILGHEQGDRVDRGQLDPGETDATGSSDAAPQKGRSLRRRVLELLGQTTLGARANEIARQLEADNFHVGGATSLQARVSHELARLRRMGLVRRRRSKKYALARHETAANAAASPQPGDDVLKEVDEMLVAG
jgi:DNA-binding transcriptional ArsR family regulator